jgi:hypothetical protein
MHQNQDQHFHHKAVKAEFNNQFHHKAVKAGLDLQLTLHYNPEQLYLTE